MAREELERLKGDTSEVRRLLNQVDALRRPAPSGSRGGQIRRARGGEWDWFYCLSPGLRSWIGRYCMSDHGESPEDMAYSVGFDYVEDWAARFVQACDVARDRAAAEEWEQLEPDDAGDLVGPDELAQLLSVTRGAIRQWRRRGLLPPIELELSGMPIWTLGAVREWAALTNRTLAAA